MKIPLSIFMVLLFLSCKKDLNDCTLICGQYDGITRITVKDAGPNGQDLVSKNDNIVFIEQEGEQFKIDNLIFTLDKDGEFESFDTADGKEKVSIRWVNNTLFLDEEFGNGVTSRFEGEKVN